MPSLSGVEVLQWRLESCRGFPCWFWYMVIGPSAYASLTFEWDDGEWCEEADGG